MIEERSGDLLLADRRVVRTDRGTTRRVRGAAERGVAHAVVHALADDRHRTTAHAAPEQAAQQVRALADPQSVAIRAVLLATLELGLNALPRLPIDDREIRVLADDVL